MQTLHITDNKRHLALSGGAPLFLIADTAWELFHRLSREQTVHYLDTRAAQGFNMIQAVILAELDGLTTPNADGSFPLERTPDGAAFTAAAVTDNTVYLYLPAGVGVRLDQTKLPFMPTKLTLFSPQDGTYDDNAVHLSADGSLTLPGRAAGRYMDAVVMLSRSFCTTPSASH